MANIPRISRSLTALCLVMIGCSASFAEEAVSWYGHIEVGRNGTIILESRAVSEGESPEYRINDVHLQSRECPKSDIKLKVCAWFGVRAVVVPDKMESMRNWTVGHFDFRRSEFFDLKMFGQQVKRAVLIEYARNDGHGSDRYLNGYIYSEKYGVIAIISKGGHKGSDRPADIYWTRELPGVFR